MRGERPQLLIEADASDPAAASNAINRAETIINQALLHDLKGAVARTSPKPGPVDVVVHARYNPEGIAQYNIVPSLIGIIITTTLETERCTLENLLAIPAKPNEVMVGKNAPYVGVGGIQTLIVLLTAHFLFAVPFAGCLVLLVASVALFLVANLALGFTFSTLAKSQMQSMQLTFFFFIPSLLLSGFMCPFRGMPAWAQAIGKVLHLTHFLRIVRGVMLKNANFSNVKYEFPAILAFTIMVGVVAMLRYKRTLN
ncbi:MAG: ABC-2 type transport system permease protein [Lentisphaeria bacterium]|jgi:ABC-2 type transport system permease protein